VLSGGINAVGYLVEKLEKRFGTKDQPARYRSQLKGRRRQKHESLYNVYDDISRLVLLAFMVNSLFIEMILELKPS